MAICLTYFRNLSLFKMANLKIFTSTMKLNHFEKLFIFVLDSQNSEEAGPIVLILELLFYAAAN